MDPSKTQDDPSRGLDSSATGNNTVDHAMGRHELAHSLSRLSLGQDASIPSPSLPTHNQTSSPPSLNQQPAPSRIPSSNFFQGLGSIPFQLHQPTLPLRPAPANNPPSSSGESSRRSSANFVGFPTSAPSPAMNPPTEGPTAASIAAEHFRVELDLHQTAGLACKTVVLVHDDCYGHRFARQTTKLKLQTIVERPERIRACLAGVAAAYVRLGRRHDGNEFAPRPDMNDTYWNVKLLPRPFQIMKTSRKLSLTDRAVTDVHGTEWINELESMCNLAESRLVRGQNELERSTSAPALSKNDLYLCSESAEAFQGALGAVCDGVDRVFDSSNAKRAFVCIRPPGHHCSDDSPSGFCWVNNVHVGISHAATQHGLTHAAIIDFDLHHGDGSQDIAWKHNVRAQECLDTPNEYPAYERAPIGYFSLHDINSFPCEGGDFDKIMRASICMGDGYGQSIWNTHLDRWKTYSEFWRIYRHKYMVLIHKAREFLTLHTERLAADPNGPTPKAAIFISAGFDANQHEDEGMQRHGLNVLTEFYAQFTKDIVHLSHLEGLGVDGRVISVLEGGYSDRALTSGVFSHLAGLSGQCPEVALRPPSSVHEKPGGPAGKDWDPDWWSVKNLEELEALVALPASPVNRRDESARTISNPTQSSSARMVTPAPEVDWATAAHELFKILIPESRQTTSHTHKELNAAATRERREQFRHQARLGSAMDLDNVPPTRPVANQRRLRVQKSGAEPVYAPRPATPRQRAMRENRRKTVDGNDLPVASRESSPSVDASRRKSATGVATEDTNMEQCVQKQNSTLEHTVTESSANPQDKQPFSSRKKSGSRQGTPKRSASPRKAPPVPKVPSEFLEPKPSDYGAPSESPSPQDDMENLPSRLRIKLLVQPPAEQE